MEDVERRVVSHRMPCQNARRFDVQAYWKGTISVYVERVDNALQQRKAASDNVLQPQPAHPAIRPRGSGWPTGAADKQTGGSSGSRWQVPRNAHGRAVAIDRRTNATRVPSDEAPAETLQGALTSQVEDAISANNDDTPIDVDYDFWGREDTDMELHEHAEAVCGGPNIKSSAGIAGRYSLPEQARRGVEAQQ